MLKQIIYFFCIFLITPFAAYSFDENAFMDDSKPLIIFFTKDDMTDAWYDWCMEEGQKRPSMNIIHMETKFITDVNILFEHRDGKELVYHLPNAVFIFKEKRYRYNREYSQDGLIRWIDDCLNDMNSPVYVGPDVETYRQRFNGSVEIISKRPLYWPSMIKLTHIGFAFRSFDVEPMFFIRSIFGTNHVFDSAKYIFHGLIDTILPYAKSTQADVLQVVATYARDEVHIVKYGPLPAWWTSFARLYPTTLFVHYQPHETDLPTPSVTVFNRSVIYQRNSTDIETVRWYHDVLHGRATPHTRKSGTPENKHPTVQEITSDDMYERIKGDVYISLYDEKNNICAPMIGDMSERFINGTEMYGRMHLGLNDHEALDENARPGFIVHYVHGVRKNIIRCI